MSRITGFKLVNICQHGEFEANLDIGMYAVVGPNGCGKTNILRGLVFGLTGLVDGLWGSKQTLQKDGASTPGYSEVRFEHDGKAYTVHRWSVAGTKFTDYVKGDSEKNVATGTKAVDAFMEQVFGMPCRLMFQVCWGRQGELAYWLTGTASMISTLLSQVFDTTGLEKVRAAIKNRMDVIANLPVSGQEQLDKAVAGLAALKTDEELDAEVAAARKRLADADAKLKAIETARSNGETEEKLYLRKQAAWTRRENDEKLLEKLPEGKNPYGKSLHELEELDNKLYQTFTGAMTQLSKAQDKRDQAQRNVDAMVASLKDLLVSNAEINEKLDAPTDVCAVCGQPVTDKEAYVKCMCKQLTGFQTRMAYEADCKKQHDLLMATKQGQEHIVRTAEQEIAELKKLCDATDAEKDVVVGAIRHERRLEVMVRLEATKAEIAELDKMPVLSKENDDEALHAAQVEFIQASKSLEALTDQRSRTQTTRNLLQEQKTYAEKLVQQHGINKEAREVLSELRDVFSQNRAQARYLRERISELNVRLQEFVSNTGMPFSLRLDEEQRLFMYKTADGYEHPAAHLSGAQKAMSAVALQMALFQVMQPNMMLYLLDEPTEALDEENKAIMGRMFHRMNMLMPKVRGTMLVVTRDELVVAGCTGTLQAAH